MQDYLSHKINEDNSDPVSFIDELPLWAAPFCLDLLEVVKLKPNITALDIGSGPGFPMIELAMRLGKSAKVIGIDPREKTIERNKLKIRNLNIKNAIAMKGTAEKLPFEDNYFHLIVSNNGINNVDNIEKSLSECSRVSKPQAQLVFNLNLNDSMIEFYDVLESILRKSNMYSEIDKLKSQIHKRLSLSKTESLLKASGFEIRNVKINKFTIRFLDGTSMFNHHLINLWFLEECKSILMPRDIKRIFNRVENQINDFAIRNGNFFLNIPFVTIDSIKKV